MNILFDLDGTLVDSKERLYKLFQHLVPDSTFSFEDYWAYKKNKIGHVQILQTYFNYNEKSIAIFQEKWMELIEKEEWLALDKPFIGIKEKLDELSKKNTLFVVTARQSKEKAIKQIELYGWLGFFKKILVTQQKKDKLTLINENVSITSTDWIVGDTGKDIETGKKLGMKTGAVLSGFLSKKALLEYEPTIIADFAVNLQFT